METRREFFTKLFGAAAPTVAVALYPAASLGLLERFFWKPLKSYFLPPRRELDFEIINEAFRRLYSDGIGLYISGIDEERKIVTVTPRLKYRAECEGLIEYSKVEAPGDFLVKKDAWFDLDDIYGDDPPLKGLIPGVWKVKRA